MSANNLSKAMVVLLAGGMVTHLANAGLVQISSPDAAYQLATVKIPITVVDGSDMTSLTDGNVTFAFSHIREARTVGVGWATWSSPPDSESATPRVLVPDNYAALTDLTISFSSPLSTFGVEAEPNNFSLQSFTATFFNGANVVGSANYTINGSSGAQLIAASATGGDVFTSVNISANDSFALAQFRYAEAIPEPATGAVLALSLAACAARRRRS